MTTKPTAALEPASGLAAALAAVQAEMPVVAKTKTANVPTRGGGSYRYTYADLADVSAAALPLLSRNGLAFVCHPREASDGYELAATLSHVSGESITGALPLHGNSPQELGSAITYARRYLLGCLTGIVTDDDDDARTAEPADRARTWDGPSTRDLIARIEAAAAALGVDDDRATMPLRRETGTDRTTMFALDPWVVLPYAEKAEAFAATELAKREADRAALADAAAAAEGSARADLNA